MPEFTNISARSLAQACKRLNARFIAGRGVSAPDEANFSGVLTDTRAELNGKLLVALRGERFDAHEFVNEECVASAVVVDHKLDVDIPQLVVDDTLRALGQLGAWWRDDYQGQVLAITGSNGKTSCKEMTAAILAQCGAVHATRGNLNNEIGVPMTLFGLDPHSDYAVIEMGANHPGEIARLVAMVRPDVALVNNAGPAHLEGFGDLEGVARAKGEAFSGLQAEATAVINADDPWATLWMKMNAADQALRFSMQGGERKLSGSASDNASDEVLGRWDATDDGGELSIAHNGKQCRVHLSLPGRHNAMNALAASALCLATGVELEVVKQGLQSLQPVKGRLQNREAHCGASVIDDTYNANPASFRAGIDVLVQGVNGRTVLVMGDMGELGADAAALHAETGRYAAEQGVSRLYALGDLSAHAVTAFGENAMHFDDKASMIAALEETLIASDRILVKGSRSMTMETVVDALCRPVSGQPNEAVAPTRQSQEEAA